MFAMPWYWCFDTVVKYFICYGVLSHLWYDDLIDSNLNRSDRIRSVLIWFVLMLYKIALSAWGEIHGLDGRLECKQHCVNAGLHYASCVLGQRTFKLVNVLKQVTIRVSVGTRIFICKAALIFSSEGLLPSGWKVLCSTFCTICSKNLLSNMRHCIGLQWNKKCIDVVT